MKILALSTAEQGGSLAIADHTRLICQEYWDANQTHSKRLVKMVSHAIENRSGGTLEDIDLFVAARGPGSFTGLRIGISVVKGFAFAMNKPASGVSSLDGIAFRFSNSNKPVCVMMDAKRGEVYSAVYQFDNGRLIHKSKECVINPEDMIDQLQEKTLFVGSGSKAYREIIDARFKNASFSNQLTDSVSAVALIQSLLSDPDQPEQFESDRLKPVYIRKSDAQLNFVEK